MRRSDVCSSSLPFTHHPPQPLQSFLIVNGSFLLPSPKTSFSFKVNVSCSPGFLPLPSFLLNPPTPSFPPAPHPASPQFLNSLTLLLVLGHNVRQKTSPMHCDITRTLGMPHSPWLLGHNEAHRPLQWKLGCGKEKHETNENKPNSTHAVSRSGICQALAIQR